ncbi:proton-coupled folate transporter-like [Asterias amurensis]|uniref:proton-coupled folate transporter-like n=1 Tax=Asterias amurensis TaxID=7602 RepID=UPI003AB55C2C
MESPSTHREDTNLLQATSPPDEEHTGSTWASSMASLLVLQLLIFTPESMTMTLDVQFARAKFAAERNFTFPVGVNACALSNNSNTELREIQSQTAIFSTYENILLYFIPVITGLPLVILSDFTGRRPLMLLRCVGSCIMEGTFLFTAYSGVSVYYALFGSAVSGACGGFVFLHSIIMLYTTDIVPLRYREVALAGIYGMQYLVIGVAPLVIEFVLQKTSFTVVYLITTCISMASCLWMLPPYLVRESAPKKTIVKDVVRDSILGVRSLFSDTVTDGRRWRIVVLLGCYALVTLNIFGFQNTVNLYGLGEPFCWSPALVGIFAAVYQVPSSIACPIIVWLLGLCLSDYWAIYLSIIAGTAQILMTALATTNAVLIYGASLAGIFYCVSQPVYVALLTRLVDSNKHGALFSLYTLVYTITAACSLTIQSYAYAQAIKLGQATVVFYVMTLLGALVAIPTVVMHVLEPRGGFQQEPKTE